jgi:hypothetical protein
VLALARKWRRSQLMSSMTLPVATYTRASALTMILPPHRRYHPQLSSSMTMEEVIDHYLEVGRAEGWAHRQGQPLPSLLSSRTVSHTLHLVHFLTLTGQLTEMSLDLCLSRLPPWGSDLVCFPKTLNCTPQRGLSN